MKKSNIYDQAVEVQKKSDYRKQEAYKKWSQCKEE
jgi:hypothetical protein